MEGAGLTIRRLAVLCLAVACLVVAGGVAAADLKIGYVNAFKVIDEAPQGEAALKKLKAEFNPRDKKNLEIQGRIKQLEEELDKNEPALKDADRRSKEYEVNTLKRDLRRATQELREDYNLRRNEEFLAVQKLVEKTIVEVARQEGYDLVLHEGVTYASGRADITEKILRKLGKKPAQP
jgi:outer membrane protein